MRALPRYLDGALAAWQAGLAGRDLHLGYWDEPPGLAAPCGPAEFHAAQAMLTRRMIAMAPHQPGGRVLDVACGLGGTLAALGTAGLTGLNLDPRQLRACRGAAPGVALVAGDACALPFADASFDTALCVEAMFHFASRATFLAEAARVLRPGGTLAISDILLRPPDNGALRRTLGDALRAEYGPWPDLWVDRATLLRQAAAAGLTLVDWQDWTAQTLPSYRAIAPVGMIDGGAPMAGQAMRWLHVEGCLTYASAAFRR